MALDSMKNYRSYSLLSQETAQQGFTSYLLNKHLISIARKHL